MNSSFFLFQVVQKFIALVFGKKQNVFYEIFSAPIKVFFNLTRRENEAIGIN